MISIICIIPYTGTCILGPRFTGLDKLWAAPIVYILWDILWANNQGVEQALSFMNNILSHYSHGLDKPRVLIGIVVPECSVPKLYATHVWGGQDNDILVKLWVIAMVDPCMTQQPDITVVYTGKSKFLFDLLVEFGFCTSILNPTWTDKMLMFQLLWCILHSSILRNSG